MVGSHTHGGTRDSALVQEYYRNGLYSSSQQRGGGVCVCICARVCDCVRACVRRAGEGEELKARRPTREAHVTESSLGDVPAVTGFI